MKIIKFKKKRNGQYELETDSYTFNLHEDLILKHNLLLTKEIDNGLYQELVKENQMYEAYAVALKAIKNRLRSRKELVNILTKKGFTDPELSKCLNLLEEQNYLNDKVYTSSFIHDKILLTNDGPSKIRASLKKNDIKDDIIEEFLKDFTKELQEEKINKLINRYIKSNHNKSQRNLFQKIIINLVNLGYSRSLIMSNLEKIKVDDTDLQQKEYDKLYQKLSKKYSGYELDMKIKQKMYQKGFSNYE